MGDKFFEIQIPTDIDGFVLLKCQYCCEFFKLIPDEMQSDDVIEIICPSCGLKCENYLTDDVIELAVKKSNNIALEMINKEFKKMEKKFKNGMFSVDYKQLSKKEIENPILLGIDALELQKYNCCKKSAKIKPLYKIISSYCPYCGVKYDGIK